MKVKVTQLCLTFCDPVHYTVYGILQARILECDSLSLLQGIFPTQGSNPGLPHCRLILYQLSHQGSSARDVALSQRIQAASRIWEGQGTECPHPIPSRAYRKEHRLEDSFQILTYRTMK